MMEYEFELRFKLPADTDANEVVERLGEAGCDDALVGIGQPGRIALKFTREAETAKRAIVSALEHVKKAVPGAKLIEAGPDFVGLTDVADMLGMSRQNMRKLMSRRAAVRPTPAHGAPSACATVPMWIKSRRGVLGNGMNPCAWW
jgi:hypothetical protein